MRWRKWILQIAALGGGGSPPSTAGQIIWTFPLLLKAS